MTAVEFLAEWAVRSSVLIVGGALVLWTLRVRDASVRLAAWTAILVGSLVLPVLIVVVPKLAVPVARVERQVMRAPLRPVAAPAIPGVRGESALPMAPRRIDWGRTAVAVYGVVALALLLRLGVGLALSGRLRQRSRPTGRTSEGIEIRESDAVGTPVALGIVRSAIVLPAGWEHWEGAKLEAVLAHERAHIQRRDPAVEALSMLHRSVLWHSPLSWVLHRRIVRAAEEASDDAAVAATRDRAGYAEVLLEFMQGSVGRAGWVAVPMARYGRPEARIQRILDGKALSRGISRVGVVAIVALGAPLVYITAAVRPQGVQLRQPEVRKVAVPPAAPSVQPPSPRLVAQAAVPKPAATAPVAIDVIGTVAAPATVMVQPMIDGALTSVNVQAGDRVQRGQMLAVIDAPVYEAQADQAKIRAAADMADLTRARSEQNETLSDVLERRIAADMASIQDVLQVMARARIQSPVTGVVAQRLADAGTVVHAADKKAILVLERLQPIWVTFEVPAERATAVRTRLRESLTLTVEAWNQTRTEKLATGRLSPESNPEDTGSFHAVFDNQEGRLAPGQVVAVRLRVE